MSHPGNTKFFEHQEEIRQEKEALKEFEKKQPKVKDTPSIPKHFGEYGQ